MAVVQPGPIVVDIRGSVGSLTFVRTRGGLSVRDRKTPDRPESPERSLWEDAFKAVNKFWSSTLTPEQRVAWGDFAKRNPYPAQFSRLANPHGNTHFCRYNLYGWRVDYSIDWPDPPDIATLPVTRATHTASHLDNAVHLNPDVPGCPLPQGNTYLYVFAGVPVNPGVNYYRGPWRFQTLFYANWDYTWPPDMDFTHWLTLTQGKRLFIRTILQNPTGSLSRPWINHATIT
jgi:hypothetical protein